MDVPETVPAVSMDEIQTTKKILEKVGEGKRRFRERSRSVWRRVSEIAQASRGVGEAAQEKVKGLYGRLMGTVRAVVREAGEAVAHRMRSTH
jgi:hypothetical protein